MKHFSGLEKYSGLLVILAVLLLPAWGSAADSSYSVGLGFEFASGDYGTGVRTDSIFMPFTVAVSPTKRLDFSLEIPYVYQSSSAVVAGVFKGMQQQSPGMVSMSVLAAMGGRPGPSTNAPAADLGNSQSGLGDMTFRAGYIAVVEGEYLPGIRPNFYVKFPTADKNKFLGTGAFDEGIALEFAKWFGSWLADGELGYTFQGKSTVLAVKDYLYYDAGVGYQLTEHLRPMLVLKGSTPRAEGASAQLETRLRAKYQITEHTGLDGYLAKGITKASPDYGTGLALYFEF
jgi:hypothetical protein